MNRLTMAVKFNKVCLNKFKQPHYTLIRYKYTREARKATQHDNTCEIKNRESCNDEATEGVCNTYCNSQNWFDIKRMRMWCHSKDDCYNKTVVKHRCVSYRIFALHVQKFTLDLFLWIANFSIQEAGTGLM